MQSPGSIQSAPREPALQTRLTLDTLGEVSEIEDVVGLCRSGQEINTQTVVNIHSCIHYLSSAVLHLLGKLTEETVQDGLEERVSGSKR